MDLQEIKNKLREPTKLFLLKHRAEFKTYGDALKWLHSASYAEIKEEGKMLGQSEFTTDILWLIVLFGPLATIDDDVL